MSYWGGPGRPCFEMVIICDAGLPGISFNLFIPKVLVQIFTGSWSPLIGLLSGFG